MVPVNISPRFGDLSPRLVKNKEMLSRYASQTMPGLIAQLDRLTPNQFINPPLDADTAMNLGAIMRLMGQRLQDPKLKGPALQTALRSLEQSRVILGGHLGGEIGSHLGEAYLNAYTRSLLGSQMSTLGSQVLPRPWHPIRLLKYRFYLAHVS